MCGLGLFHLNNDITYPEEVGSYYQVPQMKRELAEDMWKILKSNIQKIQRNEEPNKNYDTLYRYIYLLTLHKHGGDLYTQINLVIRNYLAQVRENILASINHEYFLTTLNIQWSNYKCFMNKIKKVFIYVDRAFIAPTFMTNVKTLMLDYFKFQVVSMCDIQPYFRQTLLHFIMLDRHGEIIDRTIFKAITDMLMMLGNKSAQVYEENFEEPFLEQSSSFFKTEGENLLSTMDTPTYLQRVENHINEEIHRSRHCFNEITTPKIIIVIENTLIKPHMKAIIESKTGVIYMIQNNLNEDLARMYRLFGRVPDGLNILFESISYFLRSEAHSLLNVNFNCKNSFQCILTLIQLHDRIDFLVRNAFSNDSLCQCILGKDYANILNQNPKFPEYLSLFIDDKLRRSVAGISEDDKKILLEKIMIMFHFIEDKDLFEQYYMQHLAKRLIASKTFNEDNEKSIILKFKEECGYQYTRKLEGMFKDLDTSVIITQEFHQHVGGHTDTFRPAGVQLAVRVLSSGFWPTQKLVESSNKDFPSLPTSALRVFQSFENFYLSKHCGRKLTLLPQLGNAELEANFGWSDCEEPCRQIRSYVLQVSTYQMCILMLFNKQSHWNFHMLQKETNIPLRDLERIINSLIAGKENQRLIIKTPATSNEIEMSDVFYINSNFVSKSQKVKFLPFQAKYETDLERQATIRRVTEDHKHEIEAAIIRVIKAHKIINHNDLINEVILTLSSRFVPKQEIVKRRIEVLIEREFIARSSEDRRVYEYIS